MKAYLALEDGFILEGRSFTGPCEHGGEVIVSTAMAGYQELITDPAHTGRMVCMTRPLIGNTGINDEDMESARAHVAALLVRECCRAPSDPRSRLSLPDFLMAHGAAGIEGLDTRALARHLRLRGSMRGMVAASDVSPRELVSMAQCLPVTEGGNLVSRVTPVRPWVWESRAPRAVTLRPDGAHAWTGKGLPLAVMDYGVRWSIVRRLEAHGFEPLMLPAHCSAAAVRATGARALFLSGGPGDPAALPKETAVLRELARELPTAAVCLGHQLLGRAFGGTTRRLASGHYGCNHPIKDLDSGRVEFSAQNHGVCLDMSGVDGVRVTHVNLNDATPEGFAHEDLPVVAVQHDPEDAAGSPDRRDFFVRFRDMARAAVA